jgi:hypothetical protein
MSWLQVLGIRFPYREGYVLQRPKLSTNLVNVELGKRKSPREIEKILSDWQRSVSAGQSSELKLSAQSGGTILADIWAAIAVGTICKTETTTLTWGLPNWTPKIDDNFFAQSLAGLTALQMSNNVLTDNRSAVDSDAVERDISLARKGILEQAGASSRTHLEYDPQQPTSLSLSDRLETGDPSNVRLRLFQDLLLRFRDALELGASRYGIASAQEGAIGDLSAFLSELNDNAFIYARASGSTVPLRRGIRFVRLRKHVANSRADLIARVADTEPLKAYIEAVTTAEGMQGLIEADVSDFGPGIVDHFLASPKGQFHRDADRLALLQRLLFEKLSSKSFDPAAGEGIGNALKAARRLRSFVSLRTATFWLARSYADYDPSDYLSPVQGGFSHAHVAGTHWQILYPVALSDSPLLNARI